MLSVVNKAMFLTMILLLSCYANQVSLVMLDFN